jgi:hypothetical protein
MPSVVDRERVEGAGRYSKRKGRSCRDEDEGSCAGERAVAHPVRPRHLDGQGQWRRSTRCGGQRVCLVDNEGSYRRLGRDEREREKETETDRRD